MRIDRRPRKLDESHPGIGYPKKERCTKGHTQDLTSYASISRRSRYSLRSYTRGYVGVKWEGGLLHIEP